MKYEENTWYGWNGGECPVHPETVVDVVGFPGLCPRDKASIYNCTSMDSPIVAFRVIKEHKEPREFWLISGVTFSTIERAIEFSKNSTGEIIHVREVIE